MEKKRTAVQVEGMEGQTEKMPKIDAEGGASNSKNQRSEEGGRGGRGGRGRGRGKDEQKAPQLEGPIGDAFRGYSSKLDEHYDRRERIVKASRDVTIESKRLIFLLHRITEFTKSGMESIMQQAEEHLAGLHKKMQCIAVEINTSDAYYRYARQYSPGIQEYVEAITFYEYLRSRTLMSCDQLSKFMNDSLASLRQEEVSGDGDVDMDMVTTPAETAPVPVVSFPVSFTDYLLGILDLTGELMRLCINLVATGDRNGPFAICEFMRHMYEGFRGVVLRDREYSKKVDVMKSSVAKVENVCYQVHVRGTERPPNALADTDIRNE